MLLFDILGLLPYYGLRKHSVTVYRQSNGWTLHHLALLGV
jgi:hypothetical protein